VLTGYILHEVLEPEQPADALALTASDLWPGRGWNFVFGEANLRQRTGVWSVYRNGDPGEDEAAFRLSLRRTLGTASHELFHALTMHHCTAFRCLMNGSNHQEQRDGRPLHLCPVASAGINNGVQAHEIHLHPYPPGQWQLAGPAYGIDPGPSGRDGTEQGRGPGEDAGRVAVQVGVLPLHRRHRRLCGTPGAGRGREAMNDLFEKRVRAAAVAGWLVILIAYALLLVTWIAYLVIMSARPAGLLAMWGQGDVSWAFVQTVSLWFMGIFKLFVWLMILAVLWLTLWARQLRKLDRQGPK